MRIRFKPRHILQGAFLLAFLLLPNLFTDGSGVAQAARTLDPNVGFGNVSIEVLVGRAIRIFTGVSGSVALLMFVYGGFTWLTSGGNPERVEKGKKVFTWATIGLAVIFGSYAILSALFNAIGAST